MHWLFLIAYFDKKGIVFEYEISTKHRNIDIGYRRWDGELLIFAEPQSLNFCLGNDIKYIILTFEITEKIQFCLVDSNNFSIVFETVFDSLISCHHRWNLRAFNIITFVEHSLSHWNQYSSRFLVVSLSITHCQYSMESKLVRCNPYARYVLYMACRNNLFWIIYWRLFTLERKKSASMRRAIIA